ncbi:MAG: hypothetical protein H0U67_01935 [Gemmatimonadetes bacterium]|nr:hypothetical protein [Gemmatimonadota bacterium]
MEHSFQMFAFFLMINLAGGFVRIVRRPTREDRMMAAQLFGGSDLAHGDRSMLEPLPSSARQAAMAHRPLRTASAQGRLR